MSSKNQSQPSFLKRIKSATTTIINTDIDYSSPIFDDDWDRSKQKLQPLFSQEIERPSGLNSGPISLSRQNTNFSSSKNSSRQFRSSYASSIGSNHSASSLAGSPTGEGRRSAETSDTRSSYYSDDLSLYPNNDEPGRQIVALKHIINVPLSTLTTLTIKPGEPNFLVWYFISSYFPLITACLGPVANMISFIGLIQHWRINTETGETINDDGYLLALNILSLVLGILGNISLLMNFSGRVRYLVSQSTSISCWLTACILIVIDVSITARKYFNGLVKVPNYDHPVFFKPSEGYWFAVFTAGMYLICTLILSINFLGYRLRKYPPTFNLGPKQRSLMIFTICLAIWLLCGAVLFAHMLPDLSYGSSMYFCTVSVLTIGLGDILPQSAGAKVLVLIFSLIGVLIMGLIITMIRQVVLAAGGPTIFWHQIERDRSKALAELKKDEDENNPMTAEIAFKEMRTIRRNAKVRQGNVSLILTILNFMVFWLFGAIVFHFTEGWSYFNAVYFCFLCLITIGYGDFAPKSYIGRVFFVCWGIGAIPLMTILISNVGDKLYDVANRLSYFMAKWFFPDYYRYLMAKRQENRKHRKKEEDKQEELPGDEDEKTIGSRKITRSNSMADTESIASEVFNDKDDDDEDEDAGDDDEAVVDEMENTGNLDELEEVLEKGGKSSGKKEGTINKLKKKFMHVTSSDGNPESGQSVDPELHAVAQAEEEMKNTLANPIDNSDIKKKEKTSSPNSGNESKRLDSLEVEKPLDTDSSPEDTVSSSPKLSQMNEDIEPFETDSPENQHVLFDNLVKPPHTPHDANLYQHPGPAQHKRLKGLQSINTSAPPPPQTPVANETNISGASEVQLREQVQGQIHKIRKDVERISKFLGLLKPLITDSIDDPKKRYDHDEWEKLLTTLHSTDDDSSNPMLSEYYWLSESSPLRLPLNEPNYLMMKFVLKMEDDIKTSLAIDIRDTERIIRESTALKLQSSTQRKKQ